MIKGSGDINYNWETWKILFALKGDWKSWKSEDESRLSRLQH